MSTAAFIAIAGVDPYEKAEEIIQARPGEVSALGEAFLAASAALTDCGSVAGLAGSLADGSAVFDGARPTEFMSELTTTIDILDLGPAELNAIGGPLCDLAAQLAITQMTVGSVLAGLEEQCVAVSLQCDQVASSPLAAPMLDGLLCEGAALVTAAYSEVAALVDAHDAAAADLLAVVQAAGYLMPPDVDAGVAEIPVPAFPPLADPATKTAWWNSLSEREKQTLIQQQPELVAGLPGLPAAVYDLVNRRELTSSQTCIPYDLQAVIDAAGNDPSVKRAVDIGLIDSVDELGTMTDQELSDFAADCPAAGVIVSQLLGIRQRPQRIAATEAALAEDDGRQRYLMEIGVADFDEDGTAVIGIGEVDTADNVAVVVQGATHGLASIEGQTAAAEAVLDEMDEIGGSDTNAVIVFDDYDNPTVIEALWSSQASDGGVDLYSAIASYDASHQQTTGEDAHLTLIGHSYGTTTSAFALADGASSYVDDVVVLGSPGMVANNVGQLGMDGDHVFVAMAPNDILRHFNDFNQVAGPDILGIDPTRTSFGATVTATGGVDGHGDYFGYEDGEPNDALFNSAAIAAGAYDEVRK